MRHASGLSCKLDQDIFSIRPDFEIANRKQRILQFFIFHRTIPVTEEVKRGPGVPEFSLCSTVPEIVRYARLLKESPLPLAPCIDGVLYLMTNSARSPEDFIRSVSF